MSTSRTSFDALGVCGRPLARRAYMALVVGLAVFLGTLVAIREPFRGYLAEVRLAGPAVAGLDLDQSAIWLKRADPRLAVAASGGTASPRRLIRMTLITSRPAPGLARLDDLASRWLYQYLPERLQTHRRALLAELRGAVTATRDHEDAARQKLEELRQRQLALLIQPRESADDSGHESVGPSPSPLAQQLQTLRAELARLLAHCTEEHPQVKALRLQIARLERQEAGDRGQESGVRRQGTGDRSQGFEFTAAAVPHSEETVSVADQIAAAVEELAQASRQRQTAELRLSERMQELSSSGSAADWSASPAAVVTRLGGTPRAITLALAGLLAGVSGLLMFRASSAAVAPPRIETAAELAALLEIPVVGIVPGVNAIADRRRWFGTPSHVRWTVRLAEGVVAAAVAACLVAVVLDPPLAAQVLADPFGALSETIGQWTS